jgi:D-beta-D-heptose 7-phosphate kinase/D-beta-D-heptose 1-phosphate adenosyltransferase
VSPPAPVVVIGEALLDRDTVGDVARVCPDAPAPVVDVVSDHVRPGGAGLAATLLARATPTVLVTPLADDDDGRRLRGLLEEAGVEVIALPHSGPTPVKQRVRSGSHQICRLDRGGRAGEVRARIGALEHALDGAGTVLVSDYGRGLTTDPDLRAALAARSRGGRLVWDPHPRGGEPIEGATLVTPNAEETRHLATTTAPEGRAIGSVRELAGPALELCRRWGAQCVAVTLGPGGALLVGGDLVPLLVPSDQVSVGDTCGAGDAFAAAVALELACGGLPSEAVVAAVAAAGRFVADGAAGSLTRPSDATPRPAAATEFSSADRASRVRQDGGTVVATSGCFDLLHAGHLRMLRQARQLGDHLVVCLNSDDSVRGLKGEGRPVVPAAERRELLLALDCVDEVAIFDEPTPVRALERFRPDLFVKGGDYRASDLPETAAVAGWGGHVVILPYLDDHSTTRLLTQAARTPTP